jgi:H+/Cl- antiporter ClcA
VVFQLVLFVVLGAIGGLIGVVFNNMNENITHWQMKRVKVNYSKSRHLMEVMLVSLLVLTVSFVLPLCLVKCTPMLDDPLFTEDQLESVEELLAPFCCTKGYNEVASLMFMDASDAISQLFHLHKHALSTKALLLFLAWLQVLF